MARLSFVDRLRTAGIARRRSRASGRTPDRTAPNGRSGTEDTRLADRQPAAPRAAAPFTPAEDGTAFLLEGWLDHHARLSPRQRSALLSSAFALLDETRGVLSEVRGQIEFERRNASAVRDMLEGRLRKALDEARGLREELARHLVAGEVARGEAASQPAPGSELAGSPEERERLELAAREATRRQARAARRISDLEDERARVSAELEQLAAAKRASETEAEQQRVEAATRIDALLAEQTALRQEHERRRAEAERDGAAAAARIEELVAECAVLTRAHERLHADLDDAGSAHELRLADASRRLAEALEENVALASANDRLREEAAATRAHHEARSAEAAAQLARVVEENERLERSRDRYRDDACERIAELEHERERHAESIARLKAQAAEALQSRARDAALPRATGDRRHAASRAAGEPAQGEVTSPALRSPVDASTARIAESLYAALRLDDVDHLHDYVEPDEIPALLLELREVEWVSRQRVALTAAGDHTVNGDCGVPITEFVFGILPAFLVGRCDGAAGESAHAPDPGPAEHRATAQTEVRLEKLLKLHGVMEEFIEAGLAEGLMALPTVATFGGASSVNHSCDQIAEPLSAMASVYTSIDESYAPASRAGGSQSATDSVIARARWYRTDGSTLDAQTQGKLVYLLARLAHAMQVILGQTIAQVEEARRQHG